MTLDFLIFFWHILLYMVYKIHLCSGFISLGVVLIALYTVLIDKTLFP